MLSFTAYSFVLLAAILISIIWEFRIAPSQRGSVSPTGFNPIDWKRDTASVSIVVTRRNNTLIPLSAAHQFTELAKADPISRFRYSGETHI